MRVFIAGLISLCITFAALPSAQAATLDEVKAKGHLNCGVSQGLPGFSSVDNQGQWTGLDVDLCRAIASTIFNDAGSVRYIPLSSKERLTALQTGEVDLLARNTTWTATRDLALGLDFAGINYYDGQGFMVHKELGITSALQLSGATICTNTGTTTEMTVADYFRANSMEFQIVTFEKSDEVALAYESGRCDVYTTDQSGLYSQRLKLTEPNAHVILPEIISKEPLGPVIRQGDDQWADIVRWTLFSMINAEELGVTSANVDQMIDSENPAVRRLLGVQGNFGEKMGLPIGWAYAVIKLVGNYGESFERNVGMGSPLKIKRGQNALWSDGGLQYAPPIK